jgi:hypothetical protein
LAMSFNRENVTWQSADGTWSMAFYVVAWVDPEGDEEWDVEYDYSQFETWNHVRGVSDPDAAYKIVTAGMANPGGTTVVPYTGNQQECDRYDAMFRAALARRTA